MQAQYLILPSNRFAFEDVPFPMKTKSDTRTVEVAQEVPRSPAAYILEREISNIWNRIVLEGKPIRGGRRRAVQRINRRSSGRWREFGYVVDGKKSKSTISLISKKYWPGGVSELKDPTEDG